MSSITGYIEELHGVPWREWLSEFPELNALAAAKPVVWQNNKVLSAGSALACSGYTAQDVEDARLRVARLAPLVKALFPETVADDGLIESPLRTAPALFALMQKQYSLPEGPKLMLKLDNELSVGHAMTARGGIYEVLRLAEQLAITVKSLKWSSDYRKLAEPEMREYFGNFTLSVASMGNQALAINLIGKALGFKVKVHIPAGAPEWKKDLLKAKELELVEHEASYEGTIKEAREQTARDRYSFFIDSEHSRHIFLGYAMACEHLKRQLEANGITIDADNPLNLYFSSGMGEAAAAVCFGLKLIFRDSARFYTAEPVYSPAMPLAMGTKLYNRVNVSDIGLEPSEGIADELAAGRVSGPTCYVMRELLDGCVTLSNDDLLQAIALAYDAEQLRLEPSAVAGLAAIKHVLQANLSLKAEKGVHVAWITSGSQMPGALWQEMYDNGKESLKNG